MSFLITDKLLAISVKAFRPNHPDVWIPIPSDVRLVSHLKQLVATSERLPVGDIDLYMSGALLRDGLAIDHIPNQITIDVGPKLFITSDTWPTNADGLFAASTPALPSTSSAQESAHPVLDSPMDSSYARLYQQRRPDQFVVGKKEPNWPAIKTAHHMSDIDGDEIQVIESVRTSKTMLTRVKSIPLIDLTDEDKCLNTTLDDSGYDSTAMAVDDDQDIPLPVLVDRSQVSVLLGKRRIAKLMVKPDITKKLTLNLDSIKDNNDNLLFNDTPVDDTPVDDTPVGDKPVDLQITKLTTDGQSKSNDANSVSSDNGDCGDQFWAELIPDQKFVCKKDNCGLIFTSEFRFHYHLWQTKHMALTKPTRTPVSTITAATDQSSASKAAIIVNNSHINLDDLTDEEPMATDGNAGLDMGYDINAFYTVHESVYNLRSICDGSCKP